MFSLRLFMSLGLLLLSGCSATSSDKDYDGRIIGKSTNKNKMTVFFNKEDLCWYASDNHDTRFLKGIKNFKII